MRVDAPNQHDGPKGPDSSTHHRQEPLTTPESRETVHESPRSPQFWRNDQRLGVTLSVHLWKGC